MGDHRVEICLNVFKVRPTSLRSAHRGHTERGTVTSQYEFLVSWRYKCQSGSRQNVRQNIDSPTGFTVNGKCSKSILKEKLHCWNIFFSSYNIEISNLYSYHIFKYWNFDMLCFSLFLCPNGKLGCCWNVRQVAVFTYTGIQSRVPPLGVCSVEIPHRKLTSVYFRL